MLLKIGRCFSMVTTLVAGFEMEIVLILTRLIFRDLLSTRKVEVFNTPVLGRMSYHERKARGK